MGAGTALGVGVGIVGITSVLVVMGVKVSFAIPLSALITAIIFGGWIAYVFPKYDGSSKRHNTLLQSKFEGNTVEIPDEFS